MSEQLKLKVPFRNFSVKGSSQRYAHLTLPFSEASKYFVARRLDYKTGEGEQRQNHRKHVHDIKADMISGHFTPTIIHASVPRDFFEESVFMQESDVELNLSEQKPLPLINGDHRFAAMKEIREEATSKDEVNRCPVEIIVCLDGEPQEHFLNLQKNKAVDRSHLLSLNVARHALPEKKKEAIEFAYNVAKRLNEHTDSPFYNQIKFDDSASGLGMGSIPVATICAAGASDIGTSLIGTARIALSQKKDVEWVVTEFLKWYAYALKNQATLFGESKVLTPPGVAGSTKGSATMIVGMVNLILFASLHEAENKLKTPYKEALKVFDVSPKGNFGGPRKRELLYNYGKILFEKVALEQHYSVPKELVKLWSASCFNVPALKKGE